MNTRFRLFFAALVLCAAPALARGTKTPDVSLVIGAERKRQKLYRIAQQDSRLPPPTYAEHSASASAQRKPFARARRNTG